MAKSPYLMSRLILGSKIQRYRPVAGIQRDHPPQRHSDAHDPSITNGVVSNEVSFFVAKRDSVSPVR